MDNLRSTIVAAVLLAAPVHAVAAQTVRLPGSSMKEATTWVSASGALLDLRYFHGGDDGAAWDWSPGVQFRGTIERALRRDMSVGISGSYARIPLTVAGGACNLCQGHGTVWQSMAVLRLGGGGGIGFHSVLEASAGVAGFTNFSRDADASSAPGFTTAHRSIVPAVAAGYGVGYGLTQGLEFSLLQEIGIFMYGPASAAPSGATSTPRFNTTRMTLRYAIGR